ncbi:AAA family ATPase [Nordella sp. HKS 07]|uniref:nSTAND1 domain-containing NTPase n=1 Tax=Nordella sp. HKS 07 TaxID=2712222 RepID=UPI0013E10656|nr:adenylate/guanylate cyclase domain-containing protein [Nordella sp. HKS 07]QIG51001.1 AAA family ATPase [Nordella sp. HKS 07]
MAVDRVQRKMAAILAADVAGYSRLMGRDEESTFAVLKAYREVIDHLIARHDGRIFGSAGDSVIAEFASPVEAVRCATEIQLEIDKRNADLPEASRLRFRIGINLGDVVVDGDNLMGDGVNVAARLEAMSPPGGICVSEAIYTQVRDRLSLDFLDLGEHKVKNIARPVHVYRVPLASEEQVGSPFRGLDVFDFDHAPLFFGRARAIATCTERLEQLAASGKAFLLIYGMSGSGKSSLLRAGLLPSITRPGAVAGITLWRRCLTRPSEGHDAVASLAAGLLRGEALPELAQVMTAEELATLFRSAPDRSLALIRQALGKAATAKGLALSQARLVLTVDQMEELFTTERDPASREAFVRLLAALAGSGLVWVIGTIRADFFHRCGEVPGFTPLKDGLSSYELLPPTGPEIGQIIREPARATGLRFEETASQGRLEDVLQEAAAADPGSLPLLEFVLDELYQAGSERRLLTFAAYRALGGLEGAIARRADEVVDALPAEIQDALPPVLRALTTVRPSDEAVTVRPALLSEVAATPARSALVDALIAARLLVSDEDVGGRAVVRVAHEALVSRWPRARDIINANRSFLETRARLQTEARRWSSDNKNPELLLPPGKRLAEGEEMLLSRREEIDDHIVEYVEASTFVQKEKEERDREAERNLIEAAEAAKRERLEREAERRSLAATAATRLARRTRYAAIIALFLAAIAGVGALVGFRGQREAERQAMLAETSADQARAAEKQAKAAERQAKAAEEKALAARDQALRNQSLSLAFLSEQTAAGGDTEAAILLALEALPKDVSAPDRPYLSEAEGALYKAIFAHRQTRVFRHDAGVAHAAFNPSGDSIVTSSFDKTARIWNVRGGSETAILRGHQDAVERAMFSPDGSRVVTVARDDTARIWNAASGKQLFVLSQAGDFPTAIFSPDGTRLLTAGVGNYPALWDVQTGKKILNVNSRLDGLASFSPDGQSFASASVSGGLHIWNAEDGKLTRILPVRQWVYRILFSPDGSRILLGSWSSGFDAFSSLWDLSKGTEIAKLAGHKSDTQLQGVIFSHDGRLVATVSIDGTARLWDGVTGKLRDVLGQEKSGLRLSDIASEERDKEMNSAFSRDDRFLATPSIDGTVRIWDVQHASLLTTLSGHRALIEHVEFSPADSSVLLTASHDGTARLWDIDGVITSALFHKYPPTFAVFSPDNVHLLTGGGDSVAHLWDVVSGREVAELDTHEIMHSATFSNDGNRLATASLTGRILIWDVQSRREVAQLETRNGLFNVQFSPDGSLLASATIQGEVRLWDTASGTERTVLRTSGSLPQAVFNPDGNLIITATNDNIARLLKTDGSEFKVLVGHQNRISAAAFSPDGQLVATGSFDRTARIWSIKDGSTIATITGHSDALTEVAFSQDGRSLLTASRDGSVRIWNVPDGREKAVLRGHRGVTSAQFSPNGLYVVTVSSQNRTVRLWAANSGHEIAVLASDSGGPNRLAPMRAIFNSEGTRIAIVSGEEDVQIVRVFQTPKDLINFAKSIVPRELTLCERRRFFLPVKGDVGDCPG